MELTGPYFHTGSYATLRQVVEFYNRGGDFRNQFTSSDIRPLGLTDNEKTGLVDFMLALTDDRVKCDKAPFDHPSLPLHDGHDGIPDTVLPPVGAGGNCGPTTSSPTFLGLDQHQK